MEQESGRLDRLSSTTEPEDGFRPAGFDPERMSMREKIARALAVADAKDPDAPAWCSFPGPRTWGICWRDQYGKMADAVLEAMREPSEAMIHVGASTIDHPSVFMGGPSHQSRRTATARLGSHDQRRQERSIGMPKHDDPQPAQSIGRSDWTSVGAYCVTMSASQLREMWLIDRARNEQVWPAYIDNLASKPR